MIRSSYHQILTFLLRVFCIQVTLTPIKPRVPRSVAPSSPLIHKLSNSNNETQVCRIYCTISKSDIKRMAKFNSRKSIHIWSQFVILHHFWSALILVLFFFFFQKFYVFAFASLISKLLFYNFFSNEYEDSWYSQFIIISRVITRMIYKLLK